MVRAMVLVAAVTFTVAVIAIDARATYGARTTADEPQYLLTALSLGTDADLDISDEISAGEFAPFHEVPLNPQTIELDASGQRLSPHDPLLPAVIALPMRFGGWVAAKVALAALAAACAAATLWFAVGRAGTRLGPAAVVVGGFFASPPLTAYATQVYPEVPAALCVVVALIALTGRLGPAGRAGATVAVIALPWLAVKYAPVAAVLAAALLWRLWSASAPSGPGRDGGSRGEVTSPDGPRRRWPALAVTALVLAMAGAVYLLVHRRVYGGWTVYASGDHFVDGEFGVVGNDPDYLGRSRRLVGLLIDRRFGLVAWNPAMVLVVPAMVTLVRRRIPGWAPLTAAVAAGWATATWVALTMHGWWWPGRQVVIVVPLLVVAVAVAADRHRAILWTAVVGCALAVGNWGWLVVEASSGRRTLIVDFFETSSPGYRLWSPVLPDLAAADAGAMALTVAWSLGLAAVAVATWRRQMSPADAVPRPRRRDRVSEPVST